jgi:hypothetical protein
LIVPVFFVDSVLRLVPAGIDVCERLTQI